jgi:cytochrome b
MMQHKILIWDIPVRLFHWMLVIAIAYSWYAIEIMEDLEQHFLAGYCILALVLFRLIWGFIGTDYARFTNFIYSLSETRRYFKSLPGKKIHAYAGHNPAGGLSVIAMLLFILIQVSTGLFSTDDYYFGPLNSLVSDAVATTITKIHHFNSDIIIGLIALHILAIVFYRLYKKERLVGAMFSGRKVTKNDSLKPIANSRLILAAVVFSICAAGVFWLANASLESEGAATDYYYY